MPPEVQKCKEPELPSFLCSHDALKGRKSWRERERGIREAEGGEQYTSKHKHLLIDHDLLHPTWNESQDTSWQNLREAFMGGFSLGEFLAQPAFRERSTQNSHAPDLAFTSVSLPAWFLVVTFPEV